MLPGNVRTDRAARQSGPMMASEQAKTAAETTAGLVELHGRFLRFLRARVADPAAAEDILQSAWVKAMEHGAELRQTESSVAWFYRILRNAVADHYRQSAAHTKAMNRWMDGWQEGYEPELREEACACIQEVVRELKPEYRVAIEQVDLGGASVESFAQAGNTTTNNAYVRLHRARKAVARKLLAVCGTCATHRCIDCICKQKA
jgi:RNA polymerase sigma factor (sigma-70 family)